MHTLVAQSVLLCMVLEVRTFLYGWWTTKGLTSLCIRAEWSAPLLFPFLESISQLAIPEIPIFYLVSVAKVWVSHCQKSWRRVSSRGGLYVSKSNKSSKWGVSYHFSLLKSFVRWESKLTWPFMLMLQVQGNVLGGSMFLLWPMSLIPATSHSSHLLNTPILGSTEADGG